MFGDKHQHAHMMDGVRKAAASPNTPAHLKAHLQQRLQGAAMNGTNAKATPRKPVVPSAKKATVPGKRTAKKPVNNAKPIMPPEFYGAR
jgi:hypothetical protein